MGALGLDRGEGDIDELVDLLLELVPRVQALDQAGRNLGSSRGGAHQRADQRTP